MENILNTGTDIFYGDTKVTVRRLSVSDVFKFAKLLSKVGTDVLGQINFTQPEIPEDATEEEVEAIKSQVAEQQRQIGFTLFASLAEYENDLLDFLASLTDKTLPEFKALPPEAALDVIQVLAEGEDLKRFFEKARALANKLLPNN